MLLAVAVFDEPVLAGIGRRPSREAIIDELVAMCSRVLVFRDGRISRELQYGELSHAALVHAIEGTDEA